MEVRSIFITAGDLMWVDVAQKLSEDYDWKICYWLGSPKLREEVISRFLGVVFHDALEAIRGKLPDANPPFTTPPIGADTLRRMSFNQLMTLDMMDRMDPGMALPYEERRRLYFRLVMNGLAVLEHIQPHVLVVPTSPHTAFNYVLYSLAKLKGIETLMFEKTAFLRRILVLRDFDKGPEGLYDRYAELLEAHSDDTVPLSPVIEKALIDGAQDYSVAIPFYFKAVHDQEKKRSNHWQKYASKVIENFGSPRTFLDFVRRNLRRIHRFLKPDPGGPVLKKRDKRIEDSTMSGLEYWLIKRRGIKKKLTLKKHYESLCSELDLSQPYVYVALHYQPERSTTPNGGFFGYQYLVVANLSKCVPEGWQVYVKEHPTQFVVFKDGEISRHLFDYDDIARLPNVRLASMKTSPFQLMDHARAVCTITGNSSWEALARGKPVVVLGPAWTMKCEGVFYAPDIEKLRDALRTINSGYTIDQQKLRLYLRAVDDTAIRAWVSKRWKEASSLSLEENVQRLSDALAYAAREALSK